jgi:hypothetical protein
MRRYLVKKLSEIEAAIDWGAVPEDRMREIERLKGEVPG